MPNASDFNRFSVNPVNLDMQRSMFDMDHSVKWSCNVGEVIPFDCIEILPGDTFQVETAKVIRLQPLVAPIMEEILLDVYWFFVPHRLVWSHWKEFMGENNDSAWTPTVEYTIPKIQPPNIATSGSPVRTWNVGTIADYMGLPVGTTQRDGANVGLIFSPSALPFRSYAMICNDWFRSESVMDPVHVFVDDVNREGSNGNNQVTDIELGGKPFIACKFFDYYTSALPSPQRGEPVELNFVKTTSFAPVITRSLAFNHPYKADNNTTDPGTHVSFRAANANKLNNFASNSTIDIGTDSYVHNGAAPASETTNLVYFDNLWAKISDTNFNYISINDLRTAFAMQRYLEKQARFGGRYIEFIKGFFGVDSPDARLQRSEYLGGSRIVLNINQVEQTSATQQNSTPLGNVAGMSVTADSNDDFIHSFTEHGFVIGCAVARYHHSYQDSVHKMWLRNNKYEYYNPTFANLGEQSIKKLQLDGYAQNNYEVFGYNEAWCEYRSLPSKICGEMRSVYQTPLDMWHLGDHYSDTPSLSPEWLREDKSNLDRCLSVTSDVSNQIICDFFVKTKATRVMPMYSIPGLGKM